jgi:hypothetical protein
MGPTVELQKQGNTISFISPEVFTVEYVSFEFIVQDENSTIRIQIGLQLNPSEVVLNLLVTQNTHKVTKGGIATFSIEANDANKDFISIQSDNLDVASLSKPLTVGSFEVNIPADFSGT